MLTLCRSFNVQMARPYFKPHCNHPLSYVRAFNFCGAFISQDAVKKLNSLQTNAQVLEQIRRSRGRLAQNNLPEMISFTERAGVKVKLFHLCFKFIVSNQCKTLNAISILFIL